MIETANAKHCLKELGPLWKNHSTKFMVLEDIFCYLFILHDKADETFEKDNSEAWDQDKGRSGKGDKVLSNRQLAKVSHILT